MEKVKVQLLGRGWIGFPNEMSFQGSCTGGHSIKYLGRLGKGVSVDGRGSEEVLAFMDGRRRMSPAHFNP